MDNNPLFIELNSKSKLKSKVNKYKVNFKENIIRCIGLHWLHYFSQNYIYIKVNFITEII